MFLIIEVDNGLKGYINLGSDITQVSNLINMIENNLTFVRDNYYNFDSFKAKATIALGKEIIIEKDRGEKFDKIIISAESNDVGFSEDVTNFSHDIKSIQQYYEKIINNLKKEITFTKDTISYLENKLNDDFEKSMKEDAED